MKKSKSGDGVFRALDKLQKAVLKPAVPFKFKPDKRVDGDISPSNGERAKAAAITLKAYEKGSGDDLKTGFQDLLSDGMHLCDREGWDFDDLIRMARNNWQAER